MQITDELIQQFLSGQCTEAEAMFVSEYLGHHPDVLETYLKQSWEQAGEEHAPLEKEYSGMLWTIKNELFPRQSFFKQRHIKWVGVAASLLLIVGYWGFFHTTKKQETGIAMNQPVRHDSVAVVNNLVTKQNTGDKPLPIVLADHSTVTLAPGAGLHYTATFTGNKRDVYLEGEAFFEVAKDKTKPFTVYAGLFSTTALGTSFRVIAHNNHCSVKLYTGKVVIKSRSAGIIGWSNDVFLLPGQQMEYDQDKGLVSVTTFSQKENIIAATPLPAENSTAMVFKNTALAKVLDQLSKRYAHTIEYDKSEIDGMYFTGSVLKTDSLPVILNVIARMNGLTITTKADGFLIKKSQ